MPSFRPFLQVLLALALVANGWIGGAATALHAQHATMVGEQAAPMAMADCHEAEAASDTAPAQAPEHANADCCDQGQCNCGCLHHAPIVAPFFTVLASMAFQSVPDRGRRTSVTSAPIKPAIRPPIAA